MSIPKLPAGSPRSREGYDLWCEGAGFILSHWALLKTAVIEVRES